MNQREKAQRFQALHKGPGALVIPNPWDGGSARVLAGLGFHALATSSGAAAGVLGRRDGKITRDEALAQVRIIVAATELPVSADLEKGFGDAERLALDADHEVDRLGDRRADLAHRLEIRQPGREQHVGARALEGLQALDGVLQIGITTQKILSARSEREWKRRPLCGLRCGLNSLHRLRQRIERLVLVAGGVLDRAADKPRLRGEHDSLGDH